MNWLKKSFKSCVKPWFLFCFVFGGSPWWVSKSTDIVLAIGRQDILISFILFLFWEHGLKFGSRDSHRNALLSWITFHCNAEYILFSHISTYVLSYLSRKYRIFQAWTSYRVLWLISGIYTRIRKSCHFLFQP